MSDGWDRFLAGFDAPEPEPLPVGNGEVDVWGELDELRLQRIERNDSRWFPSDGNLVRRVVARRERERS